MATYPSKRPQDQDPETKETGLEIQDIEQTAQLLAILEACKANPAFREIAHAANVKLTEVNKVLADVKAAKDDEAAKKAAAEKLAADKAAIEAKRKAEDEALKKAEQETAAAP